MEATKETHAKTRKTMAIIVNVFASGTRHILLPRTPSRTIANAATATEQQIMTISPGMKTGTSSDASIPKMHTRAISLSLGFRRASPSIGVPSFPESAWIGIYYTQLNIILSESGGGLMQSKALSRGPYVALISAIVASGLLLVLASSMLVASPFFARAFPGEMTAVGIGVAFAVLIAACVIQWRGSERQSVIPCLVGFYLISATIGILTALVLPLFGLGTITAAAARTIVVTVVFGIAGAREVLPWAQASCAPTSTCN